MADLKSQEQYYEDWKNAVQAIAPDLTDWSEGSELDALGGATSEAGNEFSLIVSTAFNKTFFETADGPEITGGPDDLQTLAVDHFGPSFARPGPQPAQGLVTFSRPTTGAGNVLIKGRDGGSPGTGVIVKTPPDANGQSQRYEVLLSVTLTGLTINASVEASVAGASSNQPNIDTVTVIETALTDGTVVVNNPQPLVGGSDTLDDAAYREFIYNEIEAVRGATLDAIEAKAKTVPGVVFATGIEKELIVKVWDIPTSLTVGDYFYIPFAYLYVADANGSADAALLAAVKAAVDMVRAAGVQVTIVGATPLSLNWEGTLTFNPSGPNFATLSIDPTPIKKSMTDYINNLPIGTGFVRADARVGILATWGPLGTNDLTDFETVDPVGDVSATPVQKLIPGVMSIV